jgi:hypothetical protein
MYDASALKKKQRVINVLSLKNAAGSEHPLRKKGAANQLPEYQIFPYYSLMTLIFN